MFDRRPDYEPTAYDDDWEDLPTSGPFAKWFGGVAAPITLIVYGNICIITQQAVVGQQLPLELHGMRALAVGVGSVSIAVFLHCHYFWGNIYHLSRGPFLGRSFQ